MKVLTKYPVVINNKEVNSTDMYLNSNGMGEFETTLQSTESSDDDNFFGADGDDDFFDADGDFSEARGKRKRKPGAKRKMVGKRKPMVKRKMGAKKPIRPVSLKGTRVITLGTKPNQFKKSVLNALDGNEFFNANGSMTSVEMGL